MKFFARSLRAPEHRCCDSSRPRCHATLTALTARSQQLEVAVDEDQFRRASEEPFRMLGLLEAETRHRAELVGRLEKAGHRAGRW